MTPVIAFFVVILYILPLAVICLSFHTLVLRDRTYIADNEMCENVVLCLIYIFCHHSYWVSGYSVNQHVETLFMFFLSIVFFNWIKRAYASMNEAKRLLITSLGQKC